MLALDTATGQPVWATAYDEYSNGSPSSGCLRSCWEIFIAPGPGGGDPGSTVYALMAFYPDDAIPTASCGGQVPCLSYGMAIGFDGQTGNLTTQLRWIDTFYEPPENDADGGGAFNRSLGGAAVSPDGSRLFVTQSVSSRPRDWDVVFQILGYDTRGR